MEGLAPARGAAPVQRDHHEAQCREGFRVEAHPAGVEARGDPVDLRAGVDVVHHRVALGGVEPPRPVQHPVDVRHPVGRLDAEPFRRRPAGGGELADVGALQLDQHPPGPVADRRHRRGVDGGRGVDEVLLVVRQGDDVVQVVVGDLGEAGAVQADPAHRAPVRILVDQPGGGEVHHPLGLVDVQDLPHRPLPGGDLPEQRAGAQVVPVQVAPAVPLRVPQHLVGQHPHDRRLVHPLVGLDAGGPGLAEHGGDLAGGRVQPVQGERAQVAGPAEVVHRRAVRSPPRPLGRDRRQLSA